MNIRSVVRTQSNIYDAAFFAKTVNGQGRRKLFYGGGEGGWVRMSATMAGWRRKFFLKKTLAKTPKNCSQKRNLDQNINDSKYRFWDSFFENIISGIQRFCIRPHVLVNIIRVFSLIFRFPRRKSLFWLCKFSSKYVFA